MELTDDQQERIKAEEIYRVERNELRVMSESAVVLFSPHSTCSCLLWRCSDGGRWQTQTTIRQD